MTTPRTGDGPSSKCVATLGITQTELRQVIAVMAAERAGRAPVTAREVEAVCGAAYDLGPLVRKNWLTLDRSKLPRTYRAHPRAWSELGFRP